MNKKILLALLLPVACSLSSCSNINSGSEDFTNKVLDNTILNGGFETSNLDGWHVEYGDAFNNDSISSSSYFTFPNDNKNQQIPVNKEGNWYLDGKGFDKTHSFGRTGAIRSSNFVLGGDGTISFKLAGAALTKGKGDTAAYKDKTQLCYLGVYTASDDKLVAIQYNDYFIEHTEDFVDLNKYKNGVYATDNFVDYYLDLSNYIDQEMYIRIVDNDKDVYYGYISVDDIRIGGELPQDEGNYYVKSHNYLDDIEAPSKYDIKNGDFEAGSLAGWEVLEGLAFSNDGVNDEKTWWNENITYDRDGNYHYGHYMPSATGKMRSSTFELGGSGFISFKLGGCAINELCYISIYVIEDDEVTELARYSNRKYWNFQFPFVPNGMRLLNMNQYWADLSEHIGKTMFIEIVDNNSANDDLGAMTIDSIVTYHETQPMFYEDVHFEAHSMISSDIILDSEYQILNGSFETGDLTGWESSSDPIGVVTNRSGWWNENFPYNKKGNYLFSGSDVEGNQGYLKSSTFKVGGIGKISFLLGGGNNPKLCYLALYNENDEELMRFSNRYFHDIGTGLINKGSNLMNMVQYVADISMYKDQTCYLKLVDNSSSNWGLMTLDSVVTYYEDEATLPKDAYVAHNLLDNTIIESSEYQINNGNFETGDLTGWEVEGNIGNVSYNEVWWHEWYSFEKEGTYFFSGWNGNEADTGTLTSESFKVGGINKISFKLGGGKNPSTTYISVIDAESEEELAKYSNYMFNDYMANRYYYNAKENILSKDEVYMANMVTYIADLSEFEGQNVKIRLVDNASSDWGLLFLDEVITYYESNDDLINGLEAKYE